MSIFTKGDIHGWNSIGSTGSRGHYRPAHHDFGSDFHQHHVWVDNVEPDVGEGYDSRNFCVFQLPIGQDQRKEIK